MLLFSCLTKIVYVDISIFNELIKNLLDPKFSLELHNESREKLMFIHISFINFKNYNSVTFLYAV